MNATHPSRDQLKAFGVGKLDSVSATTVLNHLEVCEDCRRVVVESSGDSFLGRMRDARKPSGTSLPDKSISGLGRLLRSAPTPLAQQLPPELTNTAEYDRIEELGRGGMGVVYKAHNTLMGRDEVLKVMSRDIMARPGALERFRREIQSAARLDHPNIVKAYTARSLGELLVFSMEYVAGDDLGKLVKSRGPLPVANACYYVQQVAKGLQHAHENGMVHRDIKPANLMLHVDREKKKHTVKILDFGLAKISSEAGLDSNLTGVGQMLGTPDYIAPEQILNAQSADIRADIYSLGCTLHFLLTGSPPFSATSLYELLRQHREVDPPHLNFLRPEVPVELAAVVGKMLAKDARKRFQTPKEVGKALSPFVLKSNTVPEKSVREGSQASVPTKLQKSTISSSPVNISPPVLVVAKPRVNTWETIATESTTIPVAELPPAKHEPAMARLRMRSQSRRPAWLWPVVAIGLIAILFLGLWSGGVIKVKTKEGTIVLEDLPADTEVSVDGNIVTITHKGEEAQVGVTTSGHHKLEVKLKQGGRTIYSNDVTVTLGGDPVRLRIPEPEFAKTEGIAKTSDRPIERDRWPAGKPGEAEPKTNEVRSFEIAPGVSMEFCWIPAGEAQLGSPQFERNDVMRRLDKTKFPEGSPEPAWLACESESNRGRFKTNGYWLGKYPVTQEEWKTVMAYNPSVFDGKKESKVKGMDTDRLPVENVSWDECQMFLARLNKRDGVAKAFGKDGNFALPSENQWEYACRGGRGNNDPYYWGNQLNGTQANSKGTMPYGTDLKGQYLDRPCAVDFTNDGKYEKHPWGLCHMIGNVVQWCDDLDDQNNRSMRGSSWSHTGLGSRAAIRGRDKPTAHNQVIGFRVLLSPDSPPTDDRFCNDEAQTELLKQIVLYNKWHYLDNLYPPGAVIDFFANGKFHQPWYWNYWVVGPREMRIHYDKSRQDKENGILFTFNDDLTVFTAEFTDPNGRLHKITGTRQ